jgi:hypothetical protein
MYQIHYANPNIEGIVAVELMLNDGRTAYVVFNQYLNPDIEFDTVEKYHEWLNENIERPKMT